MEFNATRLRRAILLMLLAATPMMSFAQETPYRPLEQRMPPDVRKASGVDQMTPEQLRALNAWLRQEQATQTQAVREEVREEIKEERKGFGGLFGGGKEEEPIVSKLSGEFTGWEGGSIFRLHNGQRWRVIDTPAYYVPKRRASVDPAVSITQSLMGSWRLQVEGHSVRAKVQRID
jgi:hypothetical protein